jgi:hypothetical protein
MNFVVWAVVALSVSIYSWFSIGPGVPNQQRESQKFTQNLGGQWKFNNKLDDYSFTDPAFNDSAWAQISVPANWENQGYPDYDGIGWYRYHFTVPANMKNKGLIINLGRIDDNDETYINGVLVGKINGWEADRIYTIPPGILKYGEDNVISIRCDDTGGGGGIYGGSPKITEGAPPLIYSLE